MAGKVEARKGNGITIWFERRQGDTVPSSTDTHWIKVNINQNEAHQLITKMQEAMRWINSDSQTAEWEWGNDIES